MTKEIEFTGTYEETVGRRKQAIARVRLYHNGKGRIVVNKKTLEEHIPVILLQQSALSPLVATGTQDAFDISIKVVGGGIHGQADAIRLGIARGLISFNPEYRSTLKKLGYLKRDARVRERKKYGLKSARRAPQFSKR